MSDAALHRPDGIVVVDSITLVSAGSGLTVVCGSHGGRVAVAYALARGVKAAIFNDASVGKESAGIAGLELAAQNGMAAAAVSHQSARIGDGGDTYTEGVITHVNALALRCGVEPGMTSARAAELLLRSTSSPRPAIDDVMMKRSPHLLVAGEPVVLAIDSVSQMTSAMAGLIVMTGSHGGQVAGHAVKAPVKAAFFNDAGVGKDGAGITRLEPMDEMGIVGATVSAGSARIGDGCDTFCSGVVSHINRAAAAAGIAVGDAASEAALQLMRYKAAR